MTEPIDSTCDDIDNELKMNEETTGTEENVQKTEEAVENVQKNEEAVENVQKTEEAVENVQKTEEAVENVQKTEEAVENVQKSEEAEADKAPAWSFGEWKDMVLSEAELVEYYSGPPSRPLTPLPEDVEREFEEEEWEELFVTPLVSCLYVLNLMGDEGYTRKDETKKTERTENDTNHKKEKKKKRKPRCQTKVILRRLPPTMTEGEFLAIMSPLPPHNYFHLCKANRSICGYERTYVVINFLSELDAHDFVERYHDCIFYDSKGNEYTSVCHLAPNQFIPKEKDKPDPLVGTFREHIRYKDFLCMYEEEPEKLFTVPVSEDGPITPEMMAEEIELKASRMPQSTPLLDYIKDEVIKSSKPTYSSYKDSGFSKKSSMDKMRTIKKDKRKERRDRERKEKRDKEREARGKKKYLGESKRDSTTNYKNQESSSTAGKSEVSEAAASTKGKGSNNDINERDSGGKEAVETNSTKDYKSTKDNKPRPPFPDKKPRTFKASELSNKGKDKTRWSKNSALRTHHDDKLSSKSFDKKGRSSKLDKPIRRSSLVSEKDVSNKISVIPEGTQTSSTNATKQTTLPSTTVNSKPSTDTNSVAAEKDTVSQSKPDSTAGPSTSSSGKKIVVRKVIKKVRKFKTEENEGSSKSHADSPAGTSAPKKSVSTKKVTPSQSKDETKLKVKSSEDTKDAQGDCIPDKKSSVSDKNDYVKDGTSSSNSKEKEKRVRKGRPDLQIYRPGSLRSATTKSSESNANENGNGSSVKKE